MKIAWQLNIANTGRAALVAHPVDPMTANGARFVLRLAAVDKQRRALRSLLADQLEQAAQWPAVSGS